MNKYSRYVGLIIVYVFNDFDIGFIIKMIISKYIICFVFVSSLIWFDILVE